MQQAHLPFGGGPVFFERGKTGQNMLFFAIQSNPSDYSFNIGLRRGCPLVYQWPPKAPFDIMPMGGTFSHDLALS
jgi:hypothetical protein